MTADSRKTRGLPRSSIERNIFGYIAFWQFMGFTVLLCLIWVFELFDAPSALFGLTKQSFNIFHACLLSAGVIACAIITVYNTYLQQRHIIQGLIVICTDCGKVKVNSHLWEELHDFVDNKSVAAFSHGLCPDCVSKANEDNRE